MNTVNLLRWIWTRWIITVNLTVNILRNMNTVNNNGEYNGEYNGEFGFEYEHGEFIVMHVSNRTLQGMCTKHYLYYTFIRSFFVFYQYLTFWNWMSSCAHCASFVHRALKDIWKGRRMALRVLQLLWEFWNTYVFYLLCFFVSSSNLIKCVALNVQSDLYTIWL